ncbi:MAG: transporter, partial [Methanoregulaceae archaeon]|nr:transporter [Methanoregulaceae archaeon]
MKMNHIIARFLIALMMITAFMACASTPQQTSTGEHIDDTVITTKV